MKALVKSKAQEGIWLEDVPEPTIGHNDVLIKIEKTSICGTDVHIYNWDAWSQKTVPVPMVVGHEYMGRIVDMGPGVKGFKIGDRVSGEGHITCGHCRNCRAGRRHFCRETLGVGVNRSGAFAEYLSLPCDNAFKLPDDITDEVGAILDPLGNAVHTALSFDLVGEDVLIAGAGPIGMMAAAVCRNAGARHVVITDMNEYRLQHAASMGATRAVDISKTSIDEVMNELGMQEGFDVGLEMSGNQRAISDMMRVMNFGAKVALLGIPPEDVKLDWSEVVLKSLTLKGIYGREMFETWYKMVSLIQSGLPISNVITHRFSYKEFDKGFAAMRSGLSGKVILDWT